MNTNGVRGRRDWARDEALALHVLRLAEPEEFIASRELCTRLGAISPTSLASLMWRLIAKGHRIERDPGGGGYRLVRRG